MRHNHNYPEQTKNYDCPDCTFKAVVDVVVAVGSEQENEEPKVEKKQKKSKPLNTAENQEKNS
jgi:hypothetical protein